MNRVYRAEESIEALPGIGPRRAEELRRLGFETIFDLLFHLPSGWEDRRHWTALGELPGPGRKVLLRGKLCGARFRRGRRRGFGLVTARLEEGEKQLEVVWFNARGLPRALQKEGEAGLFGTLRSDREGNIQLVNPEIFKPDTGLETPGLVPMYRDLGSVGGRTLRRIMAHAVRAVESLEDPLAPEELLPLGLPGLQEALSALHAPRLDADLGKMEEGKSPAQLRIAFDRALFHFLRVEKVRAARARLRAYAVSCDTEDREKLRAMLPFALTQAQERVFGEILSDMEETKPMARLLQGDVGSGKTAVAAVVMAAAASAGYQAALMAPTEILAEQHFRVLQTFFDGMDFQPVLLTGGLDAFRAQRNREAIRRGEATIVIGTHALIQDRVEFRKLALVIVDEQHRFGTLQRRALVLKGRTPHLLVMTATPIPRSLALGLYGDLDLSLLDEKPAGRLPVRTEIRTDAAREKIQAFLRREIEQGGRVYCVYSLIETSEHIDAPSLLEEASRLRRVFPDVAIGVLHGRMTPAEKEGVQEDFRAGRIQMLLATTVIEVGVDVPEASVMVIEGADRFGLSQLHQLRGRVGRGRRASWCIVMAPSKLSARARERLRIFASTHDGFVLAEEDLRIRGPGELSGIRQWGATLPFDIEQNEELIQRARDFAGELRFSGRAESVREKLERLPGHGGDGWEGMTG